MSAGFPILDEKGEGSSARVHARESETERGRDGGRACYEACRIQFHAVSFLVIGRMACARLGPARRCEFNRIRKRLLSGQRDKDRLTKCGARAAAAAAANAERLNRVTMERCRESPLGSFYIDVRLTYIMYEY